MAVYANPLFRPDSSVRLAIRRVRRAGHVVESLVLMAVVVGIYLCIVAGKPSQPPHPARPAGPVTTGSLLAGWYPELDGPNAAVTYQRAANALSDEPELLRLFHLHKQRAAEPTELLPRDLSGPITAYVAGQSQAIELLEAATDIQSCRFDIEVSGDGYPSTAQPHHQRLCHSAQLLYLAGIVEADRSQTGAACRRVAQIIKIADDLCQEPSIVAALLSYRIRSFAFDLAVRLVQSGRASDRDLDTLCQMLDRPGGMIPRWYIESGICNSNTHALRRSGYAWEAYERVVRVAVAVEQYRRRHGVMPQQLEDLVPEYFDEVPLDTFSYEPLKYRMEDQKTVIYSIGPDLTDNHGVPHDPYQSLTTRDTDISLSLTRPVFVRAR